MCIGLSTNRLELKLTPSSSRFLSKNLQFFLQDSTGNLNDERIYQCLWLYITRYNINEKFDLNDELKGQTPLHMMVRCLSSLLKADVSIVSLRMGKITSSNCLSAESHATHPSLDRQESQNTRGTLQQVECKEGTFAVSQKIRRAREVRGKVDPCA